MGQVTNINELINGVQSAIAYDYDLNGNRLHVYRAKNWNNGYNDMDSSVSYGYDSIGQLTSAVGHETDGTPRRNEQFGYSYDSAGNLVGRTNGVLVQSFASDPANELTNVTRNTSLTFDGNGSTNLTSVTVNGQSTAIYSDQTFATSTGLSLANGTNSFTVIATDTSANELTNVFMANLPLAQRLSYDANGNLTSDGTRGFDYDDLNQLVRVTVTNAWKTEYDYDGLMRHHVRREYLWRNGGWALVNSCYYVYAGHNVVREVNTAQPTISYTYGLALLERDSNSSNQPSAFYETDGNGNVTLMFDVNQQIQAQYLYDPYGNLLAKSGPLADVNRYRFSSKEIDLRTGLYYYGYRYYEPNLQRWLNRDPIEERGGINLYSYVKNNPVNKIDPLGLTLIDGLNEATGNTEYIGSDDGSEAGYWRNLATHDEPEDYVAYDGYAEDQRRALYDVTHPNEGFGFIGGEAGAGPVKFECMGFAGMSKGKPLFGGLGAFGNGVMYGKEWSNQGGVENVLLLDPGAGYGAYSSKGSSGGFAYGFIGFPGFELFLGVGGGYAGH
jgi:RHS repeat-associated protein